MSLGTKPPPPPKPVLEDDDWETDPDFLVYRHFLNWFMNFQNNLSEKERRWGAKTVVGSGHQESIRLDRLRDDVLKSDQIVKVRSPTYSRTPKISLKSDKLLQFNFFKTEYPENTYFSHLLIFDDLKFKNFLLFLKDKMMSHMSKPSEGYGGKFGVQTDRVDQVFPKNLTFWHGPLPDLKCAAGFDYKGKVEPHASQRDYSKGFGGQFGVQKDRVDKSALGWDTREELQKHESQKGVGSRRKMQEK